LTARRRRWSSLNRIRLLPWASFRTWFSVRKYTILDPTPAPASCDDTVPRLPCSPWRSRCRLLRGFPVHSGAVSVRSRRRLRGVALPARGGSRFTCPLRLPGARLRRRGLTTRRRSCFAKRRVYPSGFNPRWGFRPLFPPSWRGDRGLAFWGNERREIGPQDRFDGADAERAAGSMRFVAELCIRLLEESGACDSGRSAGGRK
jgi:hypothetical protein